MKLRPSLYVDIEAVVSITLAVSGYPRGQVRACTERDYCVLVSALLPLDNYFSYWVLGHGSYHLTTYLRSYSIYS